MIRAFQLAEEWQTPILVASDLHLSESFATVDREEIDLNVPVPSLFTVEPNGHDFRRFQYTESGVSPRAFPGQPGLQYVAASDEHDEQGHLLSDLKAGIPPWVEERKKMMDKRMRKMNGLVRSVPPPVLEGPPDAPLTFVAWGSTVGAVRDAQAILESTGHPTNLLTFPAVYPLDPDRVRAAFAKTRRTLLVEGNYSGQFGRLLRAETGIELPDKFLKYDGEPFYPQEIVARALDGGSHVRQ
jgi:2-oxoglutarate/2-oxoacid ferredoxin oxidoreductase subunit alpha